MEPFYLPPFLLPFCGSGKVFALSPFAAAAQPYFHEQPPETGDCEKGEKSPPSVLPASPESQIRRSPLFYPSLPPISKTFCRQYCQDERREGGREFKGTLADERRLLLLLLPHLADKSPERQVISPHQKGKDASSSCGKSLSTDD